MSDQAYLVLEYQTCQQKVSNAVDQLIRIELYVLLGVSALYAWFYAAVSAETPPGESIDLVLYLPTLLAILAWYRSSMQIRYIDSIAQYLMLIEAKLANSKSSDEEWSHVGWETWFNVNGPRTWNYVYRLLLWPGLIAGTLAVACFRIGVPEQASTHTHATQQQTDAYLCYYAGGGFVPQCGPRYIGVCCAVP